MWLNYFSMQLSLHDLLPEEPNAPVSNIWTKLNRQIYNSRSCLGRERMSSTQIMEEINRKKWMALVAFLLMDFLQILLVSVLTIDETNPFIVGFSPSHSNSVVSGSLFATILCIQLLMIYMSAYSMLGRTDMIKIYPGPVKPEECNCRYGRDEIVEWSLEIAKKSEVHIDKIFLMKSPMPNAFTFSLPLLGSALALHSNLLDVLKPEEVKAIISHEIGHIRNKDSLISIFSRMPAFFIDIIYLYIYLRLGLGIANSAVAGDLVTAGIRVAVLVLFFGLSRFLSLISQLLMQKGSREAELLSDYHAADVVGVETTINALIRLGQRVEALSALIGEISWLESLNPERAGAVSQAELIRMITQYPLDGIEDDNAKQMAPSVFLSTRLKHMRNVYGVQLTDEQIESAIEPATVFLQEERAKFEEEVERTGKRKLKPKKPTETVDWRKVDYDEDRRLSKEELHDLLEMLRKSPDKLMFTNEVGMNLLAVDHPDFRRRVLTIADAFGL